MIEEICDKAGVTLAYFDNDVRSWIEHFCGHGPE